MCIISNKSLFLFYRDFPEHSVYTTPVFFSSDWLNEYWDTLEVDDYRFVYMGPKGSWYDTLNSNTNKAQIILHFFVFMQSHQLPHHQDSVPRRRFPLLQLVSKYLW